MKLALAHAAVMTRLPIGAPVVFLISVADPRNLASAYLKVGLLRLIGICLARLHVKYGLLNLLLPTNLVF